MYNYICEDCGIEFHSENKKLLSLCDYCARRKYNCRANGKEYIPYLERSVKEQQAVDEMLCRKMSTSEAKTYLAFRKAQREGNMDESQTNIDESQANIDESQTNVEILSETTEVDILEALQNTAKMFYGYYTDLKDIRERLNQFEMLENDNLHELELGVSSEEEFLQVSKKLQNNLKMRRMLKDKHDELMILKDFMDKNFYVNQIGKTINSLVNQIKDLRKAQASRVYSPRMDKSLLDKPWTCDRMYGNLEDSTEYHNITKEEV